MKQQMRDYVSKKTGIPKSSLKKFVTGNISQNKMEHLLLKPTTQLQEVIFGNRTEPDTAPWITPGKRFVQAEETRRVLSYFLRSSTWPTSSHGVVLAGPNPVHACSPWIISGLLDTIDGYEIDEYTYKMYKPTRQILEDLRDLRKEYPIRNSTENLQISLHNKTYTDHEPVKGGSAVIDLDFCANRLKNPEHTALLQEFLLKNKSKGPMVFRTTLHIGRGGNSREEVDEDIDSLEQTMLLLNGWTIHEKTKTFYQSTLPMLSLLYIIEQL